jgi:hypothetical protein
MSQFFDLASMVLVPSGYRDGKLYSQKPLSSSGELTFSRGSDIEATRVASNGYIEKAKVNLLLQSNSFTNAPWETIDSSVTGGQSGYDGSSDARLLENTDAGGYIRQNIILSGVQTLSVYAKAGTLDFIRIRATVSGTNVDAYFDLSTGTYAGTAVGTAIDATITSMGSGWHRCSLTYNETNIDLRIYPAIAYNDLTDTSGNIYIQDAQLNYGLVAQTYQETTTAAVVSGITDNMPRLNYDPANPTCPSLLLEPSRQNLVESTEFFGASNWILSGSAITTNATTSPEGVANATKLEGDGSSVNVRLYDNYSYPSTGDYTFSVYAKAGTNDFVLISILGVDGGKARYFDLVNGIAGSVDSKIEAIGTDGWYRCSFTTTLTGPDITGNFNIYVPYSIDTTSFPSAGDANGQYVYIYGAQLEAGSYPTSLIPTYGTSATRTADACSKTGISSLIGQTEGVLFADFVVNGRAQNANILNSEKNTISSFFLGAKANGQIDAGLFENSANVARITAGNVSVGQRAKVAYAYKSGDSALYVNGTLVGTSSQAFTLPSTLDDLFFNDTATYFNYQENVSFNQALLFKTRLTNAQLAELTAL